MLAGICTCSARRDSEVEGDNMARALRMSVPTSAERTFCLPLLSLVGFSMAAV
ncbi:hypothetical protein D3C80_2068890 [compost metagenome]